MAFSCTFSFHDSLNDFLPPHKKDGPVVSWLNTKTAAKDRIEATGVPHVEVMKLVINGEEKTIHHPLEAGDHIDVFPFPNQFPPSTPRSFVLDVHLGKLARLLRLLGVDTFYRNDLSDHEIVKVAVEQNRAVLTRDVGLLKHGVLLYGYWLRSQHPDEQLLEVVRWFTLCPLFVPFSRCLLCNGSLQPVEKKTVAGRLPAKTNASFHDFFQCAQCGRVYWKGTHYERMKLWVERVRSVVC